MKTRIYVHTFKDGNKVAFAVDLTSKPYAKAQWDRDPDWNVIEDEFIEWSRDVVSEHLCDNLTADQRAEFAKLGYKKIRKNQNP